MTIEEDVRKCCKEIESVRHDAEKLKKRDDTGEHLAKWERTVEPFTRDAREATAKLDRGASEGLQKLVDRWRSARHRLEAHLQLIEAKSFLASARRLASEDDFIGAKNELIAAIRDLHEARAHLPEHDSHLNEMEKAAEQAAAEVGAKAATAIGAIEKAVQNTNSLLDKLHAKS
jgi:hypothetical protein